MQDRRQAAMVLQGFRGGQGLVVLAYLMIRQAMYISEIESVTGLSNDAASSAVKALMGKGMLVKQTGEHGKASYLPVSDSFFGLLVDGALFLPGQNPVLPDSATTTTTAIGKGYLTSDLVVAAVRQNPVKPEPGRRDPYEMRKMREAQRAQADRERAEALEGQGVPYRENLKACRLYGIGEPMASSLAGMSHVTPALIIDHVRSLRDGETLGLAIVRIRSDEMPRAWVEEIREQAAGAPSLTDYHQKKWDMRSEYRSPTDDDETEESED